MGSAVCLVLSGFLLGGHAHVVREVRDVSLPLVAQLQTLEQRHDVLKEQVELTELQSAVQVGSLGEKLDVFVLPHKPNLDRAIAFFDLLAEALTAQEIASQFSDIVIGDVGATAQGSVSARPLTVHMAVQEEGLETVMRMVELAGLLTVSDALSSEEIALLFSSSEEENPAGIIVLEQFLSQDLLRYALDPRSYEEQLKRSFVSSSFDRALQTVTQSSVLRDARRLLGGGFGHVLEERNAWPLQFMTVDEVYLQEGGVKGWHALELTVMLWEQT